MRVFAMVCAIVALAGAAAGCKKKSACVRQCERYAKCDESTPNCAVLCKDITPEAQSKLASCDEVAKGDCDQFLMCTGVKRKPSGPTATQVDAAVTTGTASDAGADAAP